MHKIRRCYPNKFFVVETFKFQAPSSEINQQSIGNAIGFQIINRLRFVNILNFFNGF